MRYRLALDVGTASLATLAYELDADRRPSEIVYSDVWIFSEPLEPAKKGGVGEPKKAARRGARQARRQFHRKAGRLRRIASLAALLGLRTEAVEPDKGQCIHQVRAKAATERIEMPDLLRVLLKLAKRRGYAGMFKSKKKGRSKRSESATGDEQDDRGVVEAGIDNLKADMAKGGFETLGQYLQHRFERGETLKLKTVGLYANRQAVEAEFDKIWAEQSRHRDILNGTHDDKPLKNAVRCAIFHQLPLRTPAAMVGRCPLEPHHPRAPMAHMAAQAFRIEKQIADLRWGVGRRALPLSEPQRDVLRKLLDETEGIDFEQAYKKFAAEGCPKPVSRWLNYDRPGRDTIRGNKTLAALRTLGLQDEWRQLARLTQVRVINLLANMGSPDTFEAEDWHLRLAGQEGQPMALDLDAVAFVNRMVDSGRFDRLSKMGFDGGRAAYSLKALNVLLPLLREGKDEHKAIEAAYPDRNRPPPLADRLPFPETTGNTVVDVAMRQVWERVKQAIDTLGGPPAQVIVELARDLPLGVKKRNEIELAISRNTKARRQATKELVDNRETPSRRNIERYLLWQDQGRRICPYCANPINLADALDGGKTNIEHILPRSLTRRRGGRGQLVLAHRSCNDEKGDRTPYQAWGHDPSRWKIIEGHAEEFEQNKLKGKAKLLLLKDDLAEILDDAAIEDWTARQLAETSWIAKRAAYWLRHVCPDVSVSRGQLTAYLRRIWGLDTVIPEVRFDEGRPVLDDEDHEIARAEFDKYRRQWEGHEADRPEDRTDRRPEKRIDHRHHLVDALVIGLTDRRLYRTMAENYKKRAETARAGAKVRISLAAPPPIPDLRKLALELVRTCRPGHRPDRHPDGRIFKELPHGVRVGDKGAVLTLRAKLVDLAADSHEKTLKTLESIAWPVTRQAVIAEYGRRRLAGKSPKEALADSIQHPVNRTPIVKVVTLRDSAETAKRIEWPNRRRSDRPHYKYLIHGGNTYLEIPRGDRMTTKPRVVRPCDALRENTDPPLVDRLKIYKGDTVLDAKDGIRYVVKQIKSASDGTLILMPVTETTEVRDASSRFGLKTVSGKGLSRLSLV